MSKDNTNVYENQRVMWNKMSSEEIQTNYTNKLEDKLCNVEYMLTTCEENSTTKNANLQIDGIVNTLAKTLKDVSKPLIRKPFNKCLKPYWNKVLSDLARKKKSLWKSWVDNGRQRGEDDNVVKWKEEKREFRQQQRIAEK